MLREKKNASHILALEDLISAAHETLSLNGWFMIYRVGPALQLQQLSSWSWPPAAVSLVFIRITAWSFHSGRAAEGRVVHVKALELSYIDTTQVYGCVIQ